MLILTKGNLLDTKTRPVEHTDRRFFFVFRLVSGPQRGTLTSIACWCAWAFLLFFFSFFPANRCERKSERQWKQKKNEPISGPMPNFSMLAEVAKEASVRKRRRGSPSDEKAVRAEQFASLGELQSAPLKGAVMAAGTLATLAKLTNPVRRPPCPKDLVLVAILETGCPIG